MTMPIDLVLVRHGESEGNVVNDRSKQGDDSLFTEEYYERHSSQWRLTDKGIAQAEAAGRWLRANMSVNFDRYYTSEYLRAIETAYHLNLPGANWFLEFYLRERDWGDLDVMPVKERNEKYAASMAAKKRDALYWTPPNGENMAGSCLRADRVIDTLHRECEDGRTILVGHGEIMWAFTIRLERLTQWRYYELDQSKDPCDRIHNGQIIQYTRRNPETGELMPYLNWKRSVCPWNLSLSTNEWQPIFRTRYTNADLADILQTTARLVNV